jgi:hypothetical protein
MHDIGDTGTQAKSGNIELFYSCMYMLGCKVALERDLSIGAIFRRKSYLYVLVPLILSTGQKRHVVISMSPSIYIICILRSSPGYLYSSNPPDFPIRWFPNPAAELP